jgi:hypothetical protein
MPHGVMGSILALDFEITSNKRAEKKREHGISIYNQFAW